MPKWQIPDLCLGATNSRWSNRRFVVYMGKSFAILVSERIDQLWYILENYKVLHLIFKRSDRHHLPSRKTPCVTCGSCINYQQQGNRGRYPRTLASLVMPVRMTVAGVAQETQPEETMFVQDYLLTAVASTGEKPSLAHYASMLAPIWTSATNRLSLLHGAFWPTPQAHGCHKSAALCTTLENTQLFSLPLHQVLCLCLVGLEESKPCVSFRAWLLCSGCFSVPHIMPFFMKNTFSFLFKTFLQVPRSRGRTIL